MKRQKNKYIFLSVLLLLLVLLFYSCSAVNQVRTVGKGNTGMELTLGGPMMVNLGGPIPIPHFFAGARYGLFQDLDIAAHLNITGLIIPGVLDLTTGIFWVPIQPGIRTQTETPKIGWGCGGSFKLEWITDFQHGLVIFPTFELGGGWRYKWFNPYIGLSLGLNFYRYNDTKPITMINPFFGFEFFIKEKASLGLKCTIRDFAYNYYDSEIFWISMITDEKEEKKYGILDITLGFSWIFGRSKKGK